MELAENKTTEAVENTESTNTEKTYTQAEVDALLQQEGDRRVSSALKKQEAKMAERLKEAQKVAAMNEQQKYEYELEQREKIVAEKEKELALSEMKNTASKILSEKGISLSLVDFVVNEDAEVTNANINLLDKAFKQSVKEEVERRLASKVPMKSLPTDTSQITKEQFSKLSIAELSRLKQEQPELFNELSTK
jgi:hypothetical protein